MQQRQYLKKMYNTTDNIKEASVVVLPIPLSRDLEYITGENIRIEDFVDSLKGKIVFSGGIAKSIRRLLEVNNVEYYDLMDRDDVAIKNAIPTAEGAIKVAMEKLDKTIYGLNVLVLGFGRVGKVLADRLQKLGANVYCEARKEKDLAEIYSMGYNGVSLNKLDSYLNKVDIIFNTVPFMILTKKRLENLLDNIYLQLKNQTEDFVKPFAISKYPITNRQFLSFLRNNPDYYQKCLFYFRFNYFFSFCI